METKEFIAYMESKNHAKRTQEEYLKLVEKFLKWYKMDEINCTKKDVLDYLAYLKNHTKQQNATRNNNLIALNHYFAFLYQSGQIIENPCAFLKIRGTNKKKLHKIYTSDELDGIFDNYYLLFVRNYDDSRYRHEKQRQYSILYRERNAIITSILFNQGTTTKELQNIELDDLDLIKATLKIQSGKRGNSRTLPLKSTQVGLFLNYLQTIRPKLLEYQTIENNKLFLALPTVSYKKTKKEITANVFSYLARQIKTIDKQFTNFGQIRSSVISFWIKTHGLRKAQYLAGHRNISTTEGYLLNNLDDLTDDINKLHPF